MSYINYQLIIKDMTYKNNKWSYQGFTGSSIIEVYNMYQAYLGAKRFHATMNS